MEPLKQKRLFLQNYEPTFPDLTYNLVYDLSAKARGALTWFRSVHVDPHPDHQAGGVLVEDDVGGRGPAQPGLRKPPLLQLGRVHLRRRLPDDGVGRRRVGRPAVVAADADVLRGPPAEHRDVGRPPLNSVDDPLRGRRGSVSGSVSVTVTVSVVNAASSGVAVLRRRRLPAVGRRLGPGLGRASAGSVVDDVVVGVVVAVAVADPEAQPSRFRGESVHFRVLFDVDDVAEVGPAK